jgi:acetoin utilization protein AcuB
MLVRDRMSTPAVTIRPDVDYKKALGLMDGHRLHHLPVVDEGGRLLGILAERDLLVAAVRFMTSRVDVADVMHRPVITVAPSTPIIEAARQMVEHKIGGLPVVDGGAVVGVITETDIFRAFVESGFAR